MKAGNFTLAATVAATMLNATFSFAQVTKEKISADPYAASGIFHQYKPGDLSDTPAPDGYEAFYISHVGRHGSRYHDSGNLFLKLDAKFVKADTLGILTGKGKALQADLRKIYEASKGFAGELSAKGIDEHRTIAGRMSIRFPSVFGVNGSESSARVRVNAFSTTKHRCQESMRHFTGEIKRLNPGLLVDLHSGDSYQKTLLWKPSWFKEVVSASKQEIDSLSKAWIDGSGFYNSIFTDRSAARKVTGREDIFMRDVLRWGSIAPDICLDDVCVPGYFTEGERFELARLDACRVYSEMLNSPAADGKRAALICGLLEDFTGKADEAVKSGSDVAADLRFAHDVTVMPLAALIGISGCDAAPKAEPMNIEDIWSRWMTSDYTPMAANLQMIFYRKKGCGKNGILVKFLLNEQECAIASLPPVQGPYYSWMAVRKHFKARINNARAILAAMPAE